MAVGPVVDYTFARRAVLAGVLSGRISRTDVCDAQTYLIRAARHYGTPTSATCPVCRREPVRHVNYAYGDALGSSAGQAHYSADLPRLAHERGEISVYVIEVCARCGWNHLVRSYLLGSGRGRRAGRRGTAPDQAAQD